MTLKDPFFDYLMSAEPVNGGQNGDSFWTDKFRFFVPYAINRWVEFGPNGTKFVLSKTKKGIWKISLVREFDVAESKVTCDGAIREADDSSLPDLSDSLRLSGYLHNTEFATLEFEDAAWPFGQLGSEYYEDGFRVTVVNCHVDIESNNGNQWIGTDADCDDHGPLGGTFRIDHFGKAFDILSFNNMPLGASSGVTIESSNGGLTGTDVEDFVVLSGPEWRGVTWVEFSNDSGAPHGVDNVRLELVGIP